MDEKPYKYENLPIPSYEEATSSRPTSSQSRVGPEEISDDAERQALLSDGADQRARHSNYVPPTVESERNSIDSIDGLDLDTETELRREMEEMEVEDPNSDNGSHRSLLTYRFKRFTTFTNSFPSLHIPSFSQFIPSIRLPKIDWQAVDANKVVIIGRLFGIFLIIAILYALISTDILTIGRRRGGQMYEPESVRAFVQGRFQDSSGFESFMRRVTEYPHLAGSEGSYVLGEWIEETFKQHQLEDVHMEKFNVYLNYPRTDGRRLAIVEPAESSFEARLEESSGKTLAFHGHSKSGDVTGHLLYANFGSQEDFDNLRSWQIPIEGSIVMVRQHPTNMDSTFTIRTAEAAGAVGYVTFSDPNQEAVQDSVFTNVNMMPEDGVQRGSISMMSRVIGDVLSPGWAATPEERQRLKPEESAGLPQIPSLPISWEAASHLLQSLKAHGKKLDGYWASPSAVEYWTGDSTSPKVNLKNLQDEEERQPIYNVIGRIAGSEHGEQKVVVGSHRDSWCSSASDPGSGTAIMLTMTSIFGELRKRDWRPLRTIEFVSWDAGEYNAVGSTEHVEMNVKGHHEWDVAYLNVHSAATGSQFHVSASPAYNTLLTRVLNRVTDPATNKTIREVWEANGSKQSPIGVDSDATPFQHVGGIPSIDISFQGLPYPKGSCYDDFGWMNQFSESPDNQFGLFQYSLALGQIWALMVLELADAPLIPLSLDHYADILATYVDDLAAELILIPEASSTLNLTALHDSIPHLHDKIYRLDMVDQQWRQLVYSAGGYETTRLATDRFHRNSRVADFSPSLRDLGESLDKSKGVTGNLGGLVNRTQYKYITSAPNIDDPSKIDTLPFLRQYTAIGAWEKAQAEIDKMVDIINHAAKKLEWEESWFR